MQGTMPGARRRGRPRTTWMDNIKTWTGLSVEESEWQRTEINGESTSMVWPTLGSRTAKEQNVQLSKSYVTRAKSSKPPRMFQWDTVDTSPDLGGVKMSSKPSKWLFDIIGGRHERNYREFSVAGFIFTYVQKNIFLVVLPPSRPLLIRRLHMCSALYLCMFHVF